MLKVFIFSFLRLTILFKKFYSTLFCVNIYVYINNHKYNKIGLHADWTATTHYIQKRKVFFLFKYEKNKCYHNFL